MQMAEILACEAFPESLYFLWIWNHIHFPFVSEYQIIIYVI